MKRVCLFLIAAMALSILPTVADNFAPPWYVGQPLSYHAEWEFANGPLGGLLPDIESNGGPKSGEFLYDQFPTHIDLDAEDGWVWDPADGDGGMVNPDRDGSFGIQTINWVDEEPEKFIRVQLTYIGLAPTVTGADGYEYDLYHGGGFNTTHLGFFPADPAVDVDQNHLYSDIVMWPNPDWESIEVFVPMGTIIDEIVVDTISIPEPNVIAMVLLSSGGIIFIRRKFMI